MLDLAHDKLNMQIQRISLDVCSHPRHDDATTSNALQFFEVQKHVANENALRLFSCVCTCVCMYVCVCVYRRGALQNSVICIRA